MQYSMVLTAALVAGASAWNNGSVSYTTEVVDQYTTYCPGATQITHAEKTYTVTEATLLTITNCPCTLTKPVSSAAPVTSVSLSSATPAIPVTSSKPVVVVSSSVTPVVVSSSAAPITTSVVPVASASSIAPIYQNTTTPVIAPVGTAPPTTVASPAPSASSFKGAASNLAVSGFSLAGVLAIAAYLL